MASFRIGRAAELLGVSVDTVRRWADAGELATERTEGGQRVVDGAELARFAAALNEGHLPDGAGAGGAGGVRRSARNSFTGLVTRVVKDTVMAQVELQAGPFRIVSLMSREAADELALAPGVVATAAVKATNVIIEVVEEP